MDKITPDRRSANMARITNKNTKPELAVRKVAHSLGFRFRLHRKDLPGKPDLVFPKYRAAIFVHGCFWHMHPDVNCKDAVLPKSRLDYWVPKLAGNQARDSAAIQKLKDLGWKVMIVWDCETKNSLQLRQRLSDFLARPDTSINVQ